MNILVTVGIASTINFANTHSMPAAGVSGNRTKKKKTKRPESTISSISYSRPIAFSNDPGV